MLPILYSFRRCPYAMRARWALLQAGLIVQWREIELKAKPAVMLEASAKGTVPVLVLSDGTVLDESLEVMRWALTQADPRGLLNSGDPEPWISTNDGPFKHHLDRFKYTDRYPGEQRQTHRDAGLAILKDWSDRIQQLLQLTRCQRRLLSRGVGLKTHQVEATHPSYRLQRIVQHENWLSSPCFASGSLRLIRAHTRHRLQRQGAVEVRKQFAGRAGICPQRCIQLRRVDFQQQHGIGIEIGIEAAVGAGQLFRP